MCRIAGLVDRSLSSEISSQLVKNMCTILAHGGPDDEGLFAVPRHNMVIGNRRLALLDLSTAGHQPMSYSDGRYHITYNGEIYNFPELKTELVAAGYAFRSNSDTEVILASFQAWGTDAFKKFNGMFAFALYDSQNHALYLVRDPAGIKPLYYYAAEGKLVFASEIRAFKEIPGLQEEHPSWPIYLMAYGHLPEPVTTVRSVKPLPKGNYLCYDLLSGTFTTTLFYSFKYSEEISSKAEAHSLIRDTLRKAVKRHLISDAPIGVFLSGGLDSSIITLLANEKNSHQLNTLSLYFAENKYSEQRYQDIVLQRLSCNHHQHLLSEQEFHNNFPAIIKNMDMPGTDGINTWFISKYARENELKAVLSGVGGDEQYGGYPSFGRMKIVDRLENLPRAFLKNSYISSHKFRRLCYLSLKGAKGKYLFLRGHFIPVEIAGYLQMDEKEVWNILEEQPVLEDISQLSMKNQASWIEMNLYMQNQLLRDSDVMSMAHGVEIRVPFLDKEFIELSLKISADIKYAGSFKKQMLIDSFKDILPEAVWNRPKMGFSFPFKDWLAKDELVKSVLQSGTKSNQAVYKKFINGNLHWSQLMSVMLLQKHAKA